MCLTFVSGFWEMIHMGLWTQIKEKRSQIHKKKQWSTLLYNYLLNLSILPVLRVRNFLFQTF